MNGFGFLTDVYALFNQSVNGATACFVDYHAATNGFYLYNDAGQSLLGPLTPGSSGSLSNSQCVLSGSGSLVSGSGNALTVTLNLVFTHTLAGTPNIFMYALDGNGAISGWQNRGTWTIPAASTPPTADSVNPNSGGGSPQNFALQYSSVNVSGKKTR